MARIHTGSVELRKEKVAKRNKEEHVQTNLGKRVKYNFKSMLKISGKTHNKCFMSNTNQ